jgi:molybdate transport system substrate-binding protein
VRWPTVLIGSVVLLASTAVGCQGGADGAGMVVFAASSLTEAADELAAAYTVGAGHETELVMGGSASLAAQIRDGAPVDVFLSANRHWAEVASATCEPECAVRPFASNSLVLAVPDGNPGGVTGLEDLGRGDLRVVMCAEEVPCGQVAAQLVADHGVSPSVDSFESSVRSVRALLALGEADVGLIYATDVTDAVEVVPDDRVGTVEAVYFQVALERDDPSATSFTDFVTGDTGQAILHDLGFGPPPA